MINDDDYEPTTIAEEPEERVITIEVETPKNIDQSMTELLFEEPTIFLSPLVQQKEPQSYSIEILEDPLLLMFEQKLQPIKLAEVKNEDYTIHDKL